ncbi:MAG: hypothetical protein JWN24_3932 [Phycisphaerales bacterium]|nr:hypothetical protein [Phycisphaerales bacterium]
MRPNLRSILLDGGTKPLPRNQRLQTATSRAVCEALELRVLLSAALPATQSVLDPNWLMVDALTQSHSTPTASPTVGKAVGIVQPKVGSIAAGYGLKGEYFSGSDFTGSAVGRLDSTVSFNWGVRAPIAGLTVGHFAVRWTGQFIAPRTGLYAFYTSSLGPVRLNVAGTDLINRPAASPKKTTTASGKIRLAAGQAYSIEIDYYSAGPRAAVSVQFTAPKISRRAIPSIYLLSGVTTPVAPTGLAAQGVSASEIDLSWEGSSNDAHYQLQRSSDGVTFTAIASIDAGQSTYADTGLPASTSFSYRIIATNLLGSSAPSSPASAATPSSTPLVLPPITPAGLTATAVSSTEIDLSWPNSANESGFLLKRSSDGITFPTVFTIPAGVTTYHDTGLPFGTTFTYEVIATNSIGSSLPTLPAVATTWPAIPSDPASLTAVAISASQVNLMWTDIVGDESGFRIDRATNGGAFTTLTTVDPTARSYRDDAVVDGSKYSYRVYALNGPTPSTNPTAAAAFTPPAAPSGLVAAALSSSQISLTWADNATSETGFEIDRGSDANGWTSVGNTGPGITTFTDSNLAGSTTYGYRVLATGAGGHSTACAPAAAQTTPQYLLTAASLATMQAAAQANTTQWKAFKARLDGQLNQVISASYQGDQLTWVGDYALGYQVLKDIDPITASNYADKAIAVMLSGLNGNIRNSTGTRMYLARGDGVTTTFVIPNADVNASTFKAWLAPVTVKTVTKGAANGQDAVDYYETFLKVSNASDGPANFQQGTDWQYNATYGDNMIDWSLPGNEPATAATYYVSEASSVGLATATGYTLHGNTITFATPPAANKALFVEYEYGTPSGGATTLGYQQTTDGRGGFNNVLIDSGYTARYLRYVAMGLDWLWGYQGLSQTARNQTMAMLVRWSDYLRDNGYYKDNPSSNYGAGEYALRMATAIALQNRDLVNAPRLKTEMLAYHAANLLPIFQIPAIGQASEQGGFWAEGWNYGTLAIRNLLTSDLAYESAGWGTANPDRAWANDVIRSVLSEQPTQSTIYDGGDGYAYPLPFPDKTFMSDVAAAASDASLKAYANWAIQNYAGTPLAGWEDLLFRNPTAPTSTWTGSGGLPLQYLSAGTGLAVARKDWNYNSTWLSFHSGNMAAADHQDTDQGGLEINRGADNLLVNVAAFTGDQTFQDKSTYGNAVVIDDGGAGQQNYRYAQGVWYGTPGVTMPHFEGTTDFTYMQGNYAAAYEKNTGTSDPASELVRDVFYVRGADYIITYDRATTTQASFLKRLQWNFSSAPTVSGNAWTVASGSSKLFGQTYSDAALTTASQAIIVNGKTVQEIQTTNTSPVASVRYVTAMQTAASTTGAMDASSHVESGDGKVEGVQIGAYVVLFGKNGAVSGGTSYSVTAAAGQTMTHYLSDMTPGATYTMTGANQGSATADGQGVLTFTTTGTGATQNVSLTTP